MQEEAANVRKELARVRTAAEKDAEEQRLKMAQLEQQLDAQTVGNYATPWGTGDTWCVARGPCDESDAAPRAAASSLGAMCIDRCNARRARARAAP